jgi:hypothetical protein
LKENYSWKKINYFFGIKNYNLPIPRPPERTSKLLKKPLALKRGHPTLQNMKLFHLFSTFVGHFCPPGSGSESTDPIESGSGYGSGSATLDQRLSKVMSSAFIENISVFSGGKFVRKILKLW